MLALPFLIFAGALLLMYKEKKRQAISLFFLNLLIMLLIWRIGYTSASFVWNLQF